MSRLGTPGLRAVQVRTTGVAMLGVVAIVVAAGVLLVQRFEREQRHEVDQRLEALVEYLDQAVRRGVLLQGEAGPDDLVQALDADGEVIYASRLLEGRGPLVAADRVGDRSRLETVTVEDEGRVRTVITPFQDGFLVLGARLSEVEESVDALVRSLLLGLPLLTLGVGVVIWLIVGRTLRPVDAAVRRERQLVDDAGHDLRTPLAGMRALLETEPGDPAAVAANRADALVALGRLEATVEDLLVLSRLERDGDPRVRVPVDLDEVVLQEAQLLGRQAATTIDTSRVSGGQVVGNRSELARVTENLLSNAVHHARSAVAVSLREEGRQVVLEVDDDGPGIPPSDRHRVFERFTRLDPSRTPTSGGSGLGLAIVHGVVAAHGGSVTVEDSALGGASFRVELPAST